MSVKNITNMAHSVRDRLLTLAKANGRDVNYLFQRYAYERFYYRLGMSEYSRRFILKGASLFSVCNGLLSCAARSSSRTQQPAPGVRLRLGG